MKFNLYYNNASYKGILIKAKSSKRKSGNITNTSMAMNETGTTAAPHDTIMSHDKRTTDYIQQRNNLFI